VNGGGKPGGLPGNQPELLRLADAGESHEISDRVPVRAFGMRVVEVLKPLDLCRHVGELAEFRGGKEAVFLSDSDEGFRRIHRRIVLSIKSVIKSKIISSKLAVSHWARR